jgi:hypothetical protein
MNVYKFSELSNRAKRVATINYMNGFNEDRTPDDRISYEDSYSCCLDIDDEMEYNRDGTDKLEEDEEYDDSSAYIFDKYRVSEE